VSADVVVGVDHDHRRALIARHDGRRQSGRSRTHDDNVGNPIETDPAGPVLGPDLPRGLRGQSCTGSGRRAFSEELSPADNGVLLFPGHASIRLSQAAILTALESHSISQ
jgi:hypothetical protein